MKEYKVKMLKFRFCGMMLIVISFSIISFFASCSSTPVVNSYSVSYSSGDRTITSSYGTLSKEQAYSLGKAWARNVGTQYLTILVDDSSSGVFAARGDNSPWRWNIRIRMDDGLAFLTYSCEWINGIINHYDRDRATEVAKGRVEDDVEKTLNSFKTVFY
jgi:hypothetical protein